MPFQNDVPTISKFSTDLLCSLNHLFLHLCIRTDNINKLRSQKKGLDLMLNSVQAQDPHNKQLLSPDSQLPRSSQCTNAESRVKEKKHFAA